MKKILKLTIELLIKEVTEEIKITEEIVRLLIGVDVKNSIPMNETNEKIKVFSAQLKSLRAARKELTLWRKQW